VGIERIAEVETAQHRIARGQDQLPLVGQLNADSF
jgi:hypothetical protein